VKIAETRSRNGPKSQRRGLYTGVGVRKIGSMSPKAIDRIT
jgi:hypothetical protein